MGKNKLKFKLTTSQDDDRPVYIAGNFNNWHTEDIQYKMQKINTGHYEYTFDNTQKLPKNIEYKYVKGNWGNGELDLYGNKVDNRRLTVSSGLIEDSVPHWRKNGLFYNPSLLPKIEVIADDFHIPQLNKTRKVTILLPHNYYESDKRYPVLYMQDGQNLFDDHAPFGNWEIDRKLAILAEQHKEGIIIVAIDHGERERITEYTPLNSISLGIGQGEGGIYIEFMKDTLKPYIDNHYRTLTDASNTGVGGSSMGGLISLYAGLMQPGTFGKLMVFSPSLWIYPKVYQEAMKEYKIHNAKVYLFAGDNESKTMVSNLELLKSILEQIQFQRNTVNLEIKKGGGHNEGEWSRAFPKAVDWLFF